jgi:glycosyltransferase involved in cell wall biosynthesis
MIVHLFNSSSVSGPERLVLPALATLPEQFTIVNLREDRVLNGTDPLRDFCRLLNLRYIAIPVDGRWDGRAIRRLRETLMELDPALVHAHAIKASAYLRSAAHRNSIQPFPIVSTHHGVHGLPDLKYRMLEWVYRHHVLKSFNRVLCVSSADYDEVLKSGIGKDRLRLHLNGVDGTPVTVQNRSSEAKRIRALWMAEEADRDKLFLLGVVGRLSREKDHSRILRVLYSLNRLPCQMKWKCLIFGTGALEQELKEKMIQAGLQERILWMGYRNDVGKELAGLDLLLSFSKAEGLPINLIEAGWAGTPVMATWVGGVKDLLPEDRFGLRVPAGESPEASARRLQAILTARGREELHSLGVNFQIRVMKEFTQDQWLQRLRDIYSELDITLRQD